ncbi:MAG: ABC transporter ATP-binding protein [Dehalococcoidia bacterium]|nr:ABC transporter ATP-binding protein [Dehalococcoidia bacterium]
MYGGGMWGSGGGGMGGRIGGPPGGMMGGRPGGMGPNSLARSAQLSDEALFGKVYDHKVVTRLLAYLKKHRLGFTLSIATMVLTTVTGLMIPALIGDAIDVATGTTSGLMFLNRFVVDTFQVSGTADILTMIFFLFIANGLIQWGAQWAQLYIMADIGRSVLYTLRMQMFDHLQKLSLGFFDRHEVGRVMSRVQNDVSALQEVLSTGLLEIIADFLSLGVVFFMIFAMNPTLALITMSVLPLLATVMFFYEKLSRNAFMKVRQAISVVNAGLQENISGARVIQAMSRENINLQRFGNVNEQNLDANLQASRLSASLLSSVEVLVGISMALVIIFGGYQVLESKLLIGQMIAFVLYINRFFEPIRSLAMQYTQLQRATAGGQRIFEMLDIKPEIIDAPSATELPPIKGEIIFDNVSFSYVDGIEVLHDISLKINPGETIALVGSTGAGKSTFVSLVNRFYEVTKGAIHIDGYDIRKVTQESLRRQTGMVLQEPFLFSGTVRDNITYGRENCSDEDIITAAGAVGAHGFIMRLENGYETVLQERGSNLSQGQRQLISFARAVLANPRILVLDEATANIDTQTEILIQKALKNILKDRTSLVIAHRLSTIHDADKVVVLDAGRIAEIGSHRELMEKGGIYYHLYTMSYALGDLKGAAEATPRQRQAT